MEVSWNRATPKSSILIRIFPYKYSILGYPHLWTPLHIWSYCRCPPCTSHRETGSHSGWLPQQAISNLGNWANPVCDFHINIYIYTYTYIYIVNPSRCNHHMNPLDLRLHQQTFHQRPCLTLTLAPRLRIALEWEGGIVVLLPFGFGRGRPCCRFVLQLRARGSWTILAWEALLQSDIAAGTWDFCRCGHKRCDAALVGGGRAASVDWFHTNHNIYIHIYIYIHVFIYLFDYVFIDLFIHVYLLIYLFIYLFN
jgi:hypothetical protein